MPLDASCAELNAIVGRPTNASIVRQGIQFVSDSGTQVGPGSDNRYSSGETIRIQVKLNLNARWGTRDDLYDEAQALHVAFMLGDTEKQALATPVEGEDSNLLAFEYTLESDDGTHSAGNVWIPENSVVANEFAATFGSDAPYDDGAPHQFISGACGGANVRHPAVFHPRSTGSPTVISKPKIMSEPLDGDTYYQGEKIWVRVEYSEPVTVRGTPLLRLRFGSDAETSPVYRNARYVSAHTANESSLPRPPDDPRRRSSTTRLLFEYEVEGGNNPDSDPDGISIDWGLLSGGSISAQNGVGATLRHDGLAARSEADAHEGGDPTVAEHRVDGSRGPKTSQELRDVGSPAHVLSYATRVVSESASGTALHAGEYVVVRAEFSEAVVVNDTRLELPIEFFNCYTADFDHRSQLSGTALEDYEGELEALGCWDVGTATKKSPTTKYAKYLSGSGHTRLLFSYEIGSDDQDRDGLIVPSGEFTYDGGKEITLTVQDAIIAADDNGTLHVHYSDVFEKPLKYQRVNGAAVDGPPNVVAIDIVSDPNAVDNDPIDTYELDDTVRVRVTFNQKVLVSGEPKLSLHLASGPQDATFVEGSDSKLLLFDYTVEAGDREPNGIRIQRDSLRLEGARIIAVDDGANASLGHRSIGTQSGHKVDAKAPAITGLRIVSSPPNGGSYYGVGSDIDIGVTYDEAVVVSGGTPALDFEVGTATRTAYYSQEASAADNDDRTIVFRYTVAASDSDSDGIRVPDPEIVGGTITDVTPGSVRILADRDHTPLGTQSRHRVETDPPEVLSAAGSVAITSRGTGTAGKYLADDTIRVTVIFDEIVYVDDGSGNAKPYLEIDIGGATAQASYASGSGAHNRRLAFAYIVPEGLEDTDGIEVIDNSLAFGGGDITDRAGNRAILDHEAVDGVSGNANTHTVDSIVPTISPSDISITSDPPNGRDTYGLGDTITFSVRFSEDVTVNGTAQLRFQIGDDQTNPAGNNRRAVARSTSLSPGCAEDDSSACRLTFRYTVTSADDDNDGISIDLDTVLSEPETTAITGTIKDRTGNRANLSHNSLADDDRHQVDAQPPRVSKVEITSVGQQHNDTYKLGDAVVVRVTFDDPIEVDLDDEDSDLDDDPRVALRIRSGTKYADYESGGTSSGDDTLIFRYIVSDDDLDLDGIGIPANALRRQHATLTDSQRNAASLSHRPLADALNQKVDGVPPTVTGRPRILLDPPEYGPPNYRSPHNNRYYGESSAIVVELGFSEPIVVTSRTPAVKLNLGDEAPYETPAALWDGQSHELSAGLDMLRFEYTVADGDEDNSGVGVEENSLSGNITDLVGNTPVLTADGTIAHSKLGPQVNHKVETTNPTVTSVEIDEPPDDDTFREGDAVMVTVAFSERVVVTGSPTVDVDLDTGGGAASYMSGSGTDELVFTYGVDSADRDSAGGINASNLTLDSGEFITDLAHNDADLALDGVVTNTHRVDGSQMSDRPFVVNAGLRITSNPAKLGTYRGGEDIEVEVTFSEAVRVTGRPSVPITIGTATANAKYTSGSGSTKLVFRYTVNSGDGVRQVEDSDDDGISIHPVSIELNNGTIVAAGPDGDAARLLLRGLDGYSGQSEQKVDGVGPRVARALRITSDPNLDSNDPPDTYEADDDTVIEVEVEFDQAVLVGTPRLAIKIGARSRLATLRAPAAIDDLSDTTVLTFIYTVRVGDQDLLDGISIDDDSLSGTITDLVGNRAHLDHHGLLDNASHLVDGGGGSTGGGGGSSTGGSSTGGGGSGGGGGGGGGSSVRLSTIRVERIGGVDRYETAKLIAERYVREIGRDGTRPLAERRVTTVVIASGRAFPDALTASALAGSPLSPIALAGPGLAGSARAPLLLTEPDELTGFTREFLVENEIEQVYIVGGRAAVSNDVQAAIAALPSVISVMRFGGADRYATSVAIASEVTATTGGAAEFCGTTLATALLAVGTEFADALALSPIAARGPHPLLLTERDSLPASVRAFLIASVADRSISQIIVAGGPSAVSDDVLAELTEMGLTVVRIGGADRYDTAVRIASYALRAGADGIGSCLDNNRIALATGVVYADGLAAGPLMAHLGGASILLEPGDLPPLVGDFLAWYRLDHENLTLTVFGGYQALSYSVVRLARIAAARGLG